MNWFKLIMLVKILQEVLDDGKVTKEEIYEIIEAVFNKN